MTGPKASPKEIALWRLERIEEALDDGLGRAERAGILALVSKTPFVWPSGETKTISIPTLYRWISAHEAGGLEALTPKRRSDIGTQRADLPDEVVRKALLHLAEDPGLTLTFLLKLLEPDFPSVKIPRSTLHGRLVVEPEYQRLKRLAKTSRRRGRFVARHPHDIWQCDAKEKIPVTLTNGARLLVYILTILDDATRAVLAALVSLKLDLAAATRVFRMASVRWGIPKKVYADRASVFDARSFRAGLACMGEHRIWVKPRNPQVRGKIEAYHRTLGLWFTKRLPKQKVVDLEHLQQLLDAVLYDLYQKNRHRGIRTSPEIALAGRVSPRQVPPTRLVDAFRRERKLVTHRVTGEVEIDGVTYLVPDDLRGKQLVFHVDPPAEHPPLVTHPTSGQLLSLRRAAVKPEDLSHVDVPQRSPKERWGEGNLQKLYDSWQGKRRPVAEPGFGLPELYTLLAKACGRYVPTSDAEAALIQRFYSALGPLPRCPTENALAAIAQELGEGRPIKTYLDALEQRVRAAHIKTKE